MLGWILSSATFKAFQGFWNPWNLNRVLAFSLRNAGLESERATIALTWSTITFPTFLYLSFWFLLIAAQGSGLLRNGIKFIQVLWHRFHPLLCLPRLPTSCIWIIGIWCFASCIDWCWCEQTSTWDILKCAETYSANPNYPNFCQRSVQTQCEFEDASQSVCTAWAACILAHPEQCWWGLEHTWGYENCLYETV